MTYTEKRLEEFDKNFCTEIILEQEVRTVLPGLKLFLAESIQQAVAEERERMVKGLLKEYKGQESQIQDEVNYIASLDKPLTGKDA